MKISPNRNGAIANTLSENRLDASTQRSNCTPPRSLGPLAGLPTTARNRPTKPMNAQMGMDPYHDGTQNDCGLHALAFRGDCHKEEVCDRLGLTSEQVEIINRRGMTIDDFITGYKELTDHDVNHLSNLSANELINNVSKLREGKQFAVGANRDNDMGHLSSGIRESDRVTFVDQQNNSRYSASSHEEADAYLRQQGGENFELVYSRSPTDSESPRRGGEYSSSDRMDYTNGSESPSNYRMDYSSGSDY